MERILQPELLDVLPAEDPQALGSRRDLRRINAWMGNVRLVAACLGDAARRTPPRRIVDLGAGDGAFLLRLTQRLPALAAGTELVLVDRLNAAEAGVLTALRTRGFVARLAQADALDWLRAAPVEPGTWVVANLFLHHFTAAQLRALFEVTTRKAALLCACEPRRGKLPLAASRWLGLIGASAVTRHDAVVSVRAGFAGQELSGLWPTGGDWQLRERHAGLFSHLFLAQRSQPSSNE
jgi:hypothetical protein